MNLDFRQLCFEQFFDKNLDDIVIESNILTENQTLRAKQLILNTQENNERIVNSIILILIIGNMKELEK